MARLESESHTAEKRTPPRRAEANAAVGGAGGTPPRRAEANAAVGGAGASIAFV